MIRNGQALRFGCAPISVDTCKGPQNFITHPRPVLIFSKDASSAN